jgi:hypothetical protein
MAHPSPSNSSAGSSDTSVSGPKKTKQRAAASAKHQVTIPNYHSLCVAWVNKVGLKSWFSKDKVGQQSKLLFTELV